MEHAVVENAAGRVVEHVAVGRVAEHAQVRNLEEKFEFEFEFDLGGELERESEFAFGQPAELELVRTRTRTDSKFVLPVGVNSNSNQFNSKLLVWVVVPEARKAVSRDSLRGSPRKVFARPLRVLVVVLDRGRSWLLICPLFPTEY